MTAWNLTDLADVPKNGLTVMSTFACGGGSSMGYKLAGFDVIAGNDIDPQMAWHYKANMRPRYFFQMPIKQLVALARARKLPECLYNLDVLDGSPPCSSFSVSGSRDRNWGKATMFREGQATQVLDDLFFDYLDLVEELLPRVSVAENVKGMIIGKAKGYIGLVFDRYKKMGYHARLYLLDAADYGVPQRRKRVFFVARKRNSPPLKFASKPIVPISTACCGVPVGRYTSIGPVVKRLWHHARPGEFLDDTSMRIDAVDKLWNWSRTHKDRVSSTLGVTEVVLHWSEPRLLSLSERIRVGSFPDDYVFRDHKSGVYMIGMSVPPFLARAVAVAIRDQWLLGQVENLSPVDVEGVDLAAVAARE